MVADARSHAILRAVNVGELAALPPERSSSADMALARPKSSILTVPSSRTLMLAGFRSR